GADRRIADPSFRTLGARLARRLTHAALGMRRDRLARVRVAALGPVAARREADAAGARALDAVLAFSAPGVGLGVALHADARAPGPAPEFLGVAERAHRARGLVHAGLADARARVVTVALADLSSVRIAEQA